MSSRRKRAFLGVCFLLLAASCAPKVITRIEKQVEYRDRVVTDTAFVKIPVEKERVVTRDTASHLENSFAISDAVVSGGMLSHSLESIPQIINVPVEVHVTDTLYKEAEIRTVTEYVEKPLSWWQKFEIAGFWVQILAFALLFVLLFLLKKR